MISGCVYTDIPLHKTVKKFKRLNSIYYFMRSNLNRYNIYNIVISIMKKAYAFVFCCFFSVLVAFTDSLDSGILQLFNFI